MTAASSLTGCCAQGLAVEIRLVEALAVHDHEGADPEPCQQQDDLPAQPPGPRHGNARFGEPELLPDGKNVPVADVPVRADAEPERFPVDPGKVEAALPGDLGGGKVVENPDRAARRVGDLPRSLADPLLHLRAHRRGPPFASRESI